MKQIKKFNELLSNEDFNSEDISMSLSDWWISCDEVLPKNHQVVIVYSPSSQMGKVNICEFAKGITKEERKQMGGSDRARSIKPSDEHGSNERPYYFKVHKGPGSYFGQEVTHWMPLPSDPGTI